MTKDDKVFNELEGELIKEINTQKNLNIKKDDIIIKRGIEILPFEIKGKNKRYVVRSDKYNKIAYFLS